MMTPADRARIRAILKDATPPDELFTDGYFATAHLVGVVPELLDALDAAESREHVHGEELSTCAAASHGAGQESERAAIVAWLRATYDGALYAAHIEAGEHHR